ncbi:MAG: GNAT family N-acetyltransferase [Clostridia bacterium]|nr:GNAT family N-acetyltransferase [Clostridia bacterium]
MEIRTERLLLRAVTEEDWRDLQAIWVSVNGTPYARYDRPQPTSDGEVQAQARRWAACADNREHLFFAVCLERRMIGYVVFHAQSEGVYECGYCFNTAFHGQGYAGEAMRALMDAMGAMGAKKLTAGTALDNAPSVRLLKSLGFELVYTEKMSFYKDEKGNDIVFDGGVFERGLQS